MTGFKVEWMSRAKHTKNSHEKIMFNLVTLGNMIEEIPDMNERFKRLTEVPASSRLKERIIARILPAKDENEVPTKLLNRREELLRLTNRGNGNDGSTLWDLYNGVTEYATHEAGTRETPQNTGEANRFLSNVNGPNARLVTRAFGIIEEFALAA